MVFPYMDHDLAGLLENGSVKLSEPNIKQYAKQLLQGTAYLHKVRSRFLSWINTSSQRNLLLAESYITSRHESCEPSHQ